MPHSHTREEREAQLALLALDLLSESEGAELRRHLEAGCAECEAGLRGYRAAAAALADSLVPREPRPELRERVLAAAVQTPGPQVWKRWDAQPATPLHVVRRGEGSWERVREGVEARRLFVDPGRDIVTMLVRMAPGARYVPHRHAGPEQCFVLEGDLRDENHEFHAGDFQCASEGTEHGAQWTTNGCLLLIVSSLHDQLLT